MNFAAGEYTPLGHARQAGDESSERHLETGKEVDG